MTPEITMPADEDLQAALLDAAQGIEVVETGHTEACLIEMAIRTPDDQRSHRFCLSRNAGADATKLTTACGRLATRHIVLSRYSGGAEVAHTRMTLQRTCPSGEQFGCDGLEKSGLTLFGYTQPDGELAQARAGCEHLGGTWRIPS